MKVSLRILKPANAPRTVIADRGSVLICRSAAVSKTSRSLSLRCGWRCAHSRAPRIFKLGHSPDRVMIDFIGLFFYLW
jgi:hypothetical protein